MISLKTSLKNFDVCLIWLIFSSKSVRHQSIYDYGMDFMK